ncbi:MAG TPA: uracil phosphoribosyltransferase [Firmicutes bacterium]|nr:uracil phosphoribosyltransferase [Bacillota bacterium]
MFDNVFVVEHPLVQHKLTYLRDKNTSSANFRRLVTEISTLMCYEATRDLPLTETEIETPITSMKAKIIAGRKLAFVPVLRAGLGMCEGVLSLIPAAKVGHIGLQRDHETFEPMSYYCKLPPDISERDVIVLDPMLATGGSAVFAVDTIKKHNPKSIKFMCIIASPEGIARLSSTHSDVKIFCASVDERLNEKAYIVPGLGDAGDRIFGTD